MTTYSTSLKLTLPGDGELSGVWGQTTNNNLGTLLEEAIVGSVNITMFDANYTLSNLNGTTDEARQAILVVGGTNSTIRKVIAPLAKKIYTITNNTSGGFPIQIGATTGAYVVIPNGMTTTVYCNGTDFLSAFNGVTDNFGVTNNFVVAGTSTLLGAVTTGSTLGVTGLITGSAGISTTTGTFSGNLASLGSVSGASGIFGPVSGTTGTFTGAITANGAISTVNPANIVSGGYVIATGGILQSGDSAGTYSRIKFDGTISKDNGATFYPIVMGNSGTYAISISGNAATATTATSPASGGSFITSSNIGSQSVSYAATAGTANALNSANNYYVSHLQASDGALTSGNQSGGGVYTSFDYNGNMYTSSNGRSAAIVRVGDNTNFTGLTVYNTVSCYPSDGYPDANNRAMVNYDYRIGSWGVGTGGTYLQVFIDGNAYGISIFPSDERIKNNIVPSTYDALNTIKQIQFKEFDYNPEKTFARGHIKCGVVSQQLQAIDPDLVVEVDNHRDQQNKLLQPNENKLLNIALKAIQQLEAKVVELEAKLVTK